VRLVLWSRTLVLLRPPNFHQHRGGWQPLNNHHHSDGLPSAWRCFWVPFTEYCIGELDGAADDSLWLIYSPMPACHLPQFDRRTPPPPCVVSVLLSNINITINILAEFSHISQKPSHARSGLREVSDTKSDLQGHSRSLAWVPFDRPYMISY